MDDVGNKHSESGNLDQERQMPHELPHIWMLALIFWMCVLELEDP